MPSTEPKARQPRGEQTGGEPEASGGPKMQATLVPSGVVEVAPLQVDDSPLGTRHDVPKVRGSTAFRWGKGNSYTRKKMMGRKRMVDYMGSNSDD